MTDLTAERLALLKQHRLPDLDLGDGYLYPHYQGNSILNLPSSVCQLLGAPGLGAPALDPALLAPLGAGIRHVVVILMDGLALHRLQRWIGDGSAPLWGRLAENGVLAPLTSISPSTTCAAMTSLWTGRSPAEHGIVGYEMFMKEYGLVANMITHGPASFEGSTGLLSRAGFKPAEYLPFPTLGTHLEAHGVKVAAFQHYTIAGSGISQMTFKGANIQPFGTLTDLWVGVRNLLERQRHERLYTWVYWDRIDHYSHHHGPDSELPAAEFVSFTEAFQRLFLNKLSLAARQDTAVILLADHGQIATTPDPHYELRTHPSLSRRLHFNPTGENRLMFLYVRPGQTEAVREYIERTWLRTFKVVDSAYLAESGLLGPGEVHPRLGERLGDLAVFPGRQDYLWWAPVENFLLGRHGGLHPEEMLVPFLAFRLDG